MDILTCFFTDFFLLSAVLGVHNMLNNPKFDEETPNSKDGKGPVRSKLTRNLWFCEAWEPPRAAGRRGLLTGPPGAS